MNQNSFDNPGQPVTTGKRIEAKDLRCRERLPLHEVIPLPGPLVIYIDPTNRCNFRCAFCPTADKALLRQTGRPAGRMSMDLFRKVVADLRDFPTPVRLASLYKDGEPLLHPQFPDMVAHLRQEGVAERIWTKTNGSLLTPALNRRLIDAGLNMICISVDAVSAEGYYRIAKTKLDYEHFREGVADLFSNRGTCEIYVKIADSALSPEEIAKFYQDFQSISTHIAVEKLMGWSNSGLKDFTLGTNPDTYDGLPLIDKTVCAYPFYVMAVNSDGSVSLCGNDWSHQTVVGNVKNQSLLEIWQGEQRFQLQKLHLENRREENRACGTCYYLRIVPDNLDPYRMEILQRLQEHRKNAADSKNAPANQTITDSQP